MPAPIARSTWSRPSGRAAAGIVRHSVVNRVKAVRNCASPRQHSAREMAASLQSGHLHTLVSSHLILLETLGLGIKGTQKRRLQLRNLRNLPPRVQEQRRQAALESAKARAKTLKAAQRGAPGLHDRFGCQQIHPALTAEAT